MMNPIQDICSDIKGPFVTVDPGLGGTGWAYFLEKSQPPAKFGVLRETKGLWQARAKKISDQFGGLIAAFDRCPVLIEWPGFWGGSMKSFTSMERGDLFKLCYLIGSLAAVCPRTPYLISPLVWKGQLSKEAVKRRIVRSLGDAYKDVPEHATDAIGMGLILGGLI